MASGRTMSDPDTRAIVVAAARDNAFDLYLAALLAPRARRDDLIALAAFEGELNRVATSVSEPMRGEFRLQWWRDLAAAEGEAASGNPIGDALADCVRRNALSRQGLRASIDARSAELDPGEIASYPAFLAYLDSSDGAAMRRAARVLAGRSVGAEQEDFLTHAGRAVALARLIGAVARGGAGALRFLGDLAHRGVLPARSAAPIVTGTAEIGRWIAGEARAELGRAKALLPMQSSHARLSALPLALVEPYLHAWEGHDPSGGTAPPPILPLSRVWRLWRLARFAKL